MDQIITDYSDLRKYRTELPNLYDDADLDPSEFRLLAHYKRVGTCTESIATTARKCRMGEGTVSEKRRGLVEKGFITAEEVPVLNGFSYRIEVIDLWLENFARYSGKSIEQIKRALDELGAAPPLTGEIYKLYEGNIGPLTPMIANALRDAEDTYAFDWISDAIRLAVENNKRNWRYCEAILKRWQVQGFKDEGKKAQTQRKPSKPQDGASALDRYAKEQGYSDGK